MNWPKSSAAAVQDEIDRLKKELASANDAWYAATAGNSTLAKELAAAKEELAADHDENSCLRRRYRELTKENCLRRRYRELTKENGVLEKELITAKEEIAAAWRQADWQYEKIAVLNQDLDAANNENNILRRQANCYRELERTLAARAKAADAGSRRCVDDLKYYRDLCDKRTQEVGELRVQLAAVRQELTALKARRQGTDA